MKYSTLWQVCILVTQTLVDGHIFQKREGKKDNMVSWQELWPGRRKPGSQALAYTAGSWQVTPTSEPQLPRARMGSELMEIAQARRARRRHPDPVLLHRRRQGVCAQMDHPGAAALAALGEVSGGSSAESQLRGPRAPILLWTLLLSTSTEAILTWLTKMFPATLRVSVAMVPKVACISQAI